MPTKSAAIPTPSKAAPWYHIPPKQAVGVEHPCLVQNVDKAVEMLGGDQAIKTFLHEGHAGKPINLKFHPEDPFSQPIVSVNRQANDVLLKVVVPKRTGRKRKRGSDEPFAKDLNESPPKKSARYLLQSLQDNKSSYQIEPVASIPAVHVFRTMPDFAYSTSHSQFLNQFRDKVLPYQYPLLSDFQLNPGRGLETTEIIPPPVLSTMSYPSNYAYRQNPAIKAFIDPTTGSRRLFNTQAPARIHTQQCQWHTPPSQIPNDVSPSAPPLGLEAHNFRGLVTILRTVFARRPIWTRRGLANQLPPNAPIFLAKYAIGYVAYAMRSGPWRDTYIRLGIDPRSDPSFRQYQSLMLQLVSSKKTSAENKKYEDTALRSWRRDPDKNSHIFTGRGGVPWDGKSWQLCDLQDPILRQLVDIPALYLREKCEERYFGWYQNGTWCKLKIILKAKVDLMMEGITPDMEFDLKFDRLLKLPESYNVPAIPDEVRQQTSSEDHLRREGPSLWKSAGREGDPLLGFLPRNASKLELEWASQYRALCRAPQGKLPHSGRLSRSKEKTRASFVGGDDANEEAGRNTWARKGTHFGRRTQTESQERGESGSVGTGGIAGPTANTHDGEEDGLAEDEMEELELESEEDEEGEEDDDEGELEVEVQDKVENDPTDEVQDSPAAISDVEYRNEEDD
jgi:general transcription factor 3C polypeptide 5 (transcription factor C subunit 1)